jgi:selenocysteine lyase/cysteine desulfurase
LFGPRGTGILWGKSSSWQYTGRTIPPFEGQPYVAWLNGRDPQLLPGGINMTPGGFHSFEHRWALPVAFENHTKLGGERVQTHIHGLNTQLKTGLKGMRHVTLYTPMSPKLSSGIVCFDVAGMKAEAVIQRLFEKRIVGSTTPYSPSYARLTPGLLNTPAEVDSALAAIREFA